MSLGRAARYLTRPLAALVLSGLVATAASKGAVRAQTRPPVTFNRDVAPILYGNCTTCHRPGESAPFSLLTYSDAKQRAGLIAAVTTSHLMPPWQPESAEGEFSGERRLDFAEIDLLRRWVEDGLQEGNPEDRPAVPSFTNGWQLGVPDLVVSMPIPFGVPADGPDVFRNFVLPIPLNARRYVRALEFRPGNARVLHHARILLDDTSEVRRLAAKETVPGFPGMEVSLEAAGFEPDSHFLFWKPSTPAVVEPVGLAWRLEPATRKLPASPRLEG
jgi:hypothetical protein